MQVQAGAKLIKVMLDVLQPETDSEEETHSIECVIFAVPEDLTLGGSLDYVEANLDQIVELLGFSSTEDEVTIDSVGFFEQDALFLTLEADVLTGTEPDVAVH
jgi:hypothetical protein